MRSHSMIYLDFVRPGFINNFQFLFTFISFSKYYYLLTSVSTNSEKFDFRLSEKTGGRCKVMIQIPEVYTGSYNESPCKF